MIGVAPLFTDDMMWQLDNDASLQLGRVSPLIVYLVITKYSVQASRRTSEAFLENCPLHARVSEVASIKLHVPYANSSER